MTARPSVIILGVDTPIGLALVRELGGGGCHVHGIGRTAGAIGGASRYCHSFSVRPAGLALDAWLPDLIAQTGADALFAISEGDLLALAALPPRIGSCHILTPRAEPLALVLDKAATLDAAARIGIDVPRSWQPTLADHDAASAAVPPFPLVAKWADPNAAQPLLAPFALPLVKSELIDGPAALADLLDRYRPVGHWPLVQSYCPGVGVGQMLHMAGGCATMTFQHQRLHEWPPSGGVSTLCMALPDHLHREQMARSEALLAAIGWTGPAMVEYRYDAAAGRFWLMEINGRFWGSLPLAVAAGAHFAREQLATAVPDYVPPPPRRNGGNLRARFMVPEVRRLLSILKSNSAEGRGRALLGFITGYFDLRMRYYVWRWSDPMPFCRDLATIVSGLWRRRAQPAEIAAPDA